MPQVIEFNRPTALEFLKLYRDAVARGDEVFEFKGSPVLVDYAKYMIEYLVLRGPLTPKD